MSLFDTVCQEILACSACRLASGRTHAVPGEGSQTAELMFIGEAPGEYEDRLGRPFVGAAGKFLDELLGMIGFDRKSVYIANVIKCRPPANRDPLPDEISTCKPFLDRQIELINPKVIVTLGRFSMSLFLPGSTIGKCHGKEVVKNGITYFPMYHPAAALHQQSLRQVIQSDALKIPAVLAMRQRTPSENEPDQPSGGQLSLF